MFIKCMIENDKSLVNRTRNLDSERSLRRAVGTRVLSTRSSKVGHILLRWLAVTSGVFLFNS